MSPGPVRWRISHKRTPQSENHSLIKAFVSFPSTKNNKLTLGIDHSETGLQTLVVNDEVWQSYGKDIVKFVDWYGKQAKLPLPVNYDEVFEFIDENYRFLPIQQFPIGTVIRSRRRDWTNQPHVIKGFNDEKLKFFVWDIQTEFCLYAIEALDVPAAGRGYIKENEIEVLADNVESYRKQVQAMDHTPRPKRKRQRRDRTPSPSPTYVPRKRRFKRNTNSNCQEDSKIRELMECGLRDLPTDIKSTIADFLWRGGTYLCSRCKVKFFVNEWYEVRPSYIEQQDGSDWFWFLQPRSKFSYLKNKSRLCETCLGHLLDNKIVRKRNAFEGSAPEELREFMTEH